MTAWRDRWLFVGTDQVGSIRPVGGSWACYFLGELIAVRPDEQSARACVERYHKAQTSTVHPEDEMVGRSRERELQRQKGYDE